ncbi:hypothetical protein BD311DRAFT_677737 [Dichomitus squalens]|nr:hypothetical protein BD311DRAFT_677737 [Dichomitus squalens]
MLGWGSLIVAAGVSYYYAKQTIVERRQMQEAEGKRPSEKLDWRSRIERQERQASSTQGTSTAPASGVDTKK